MIQQEISLDQSLNKILAEITNNWKINLGEINLDLNNHDYDSKKREAVQKKTTRIRR
jgi:hypothetical protein